MLRSKLLDGAKVTIKTIPMSKLTDKNRRESTLARDEHIHELYRRIMKELGEVAPYVSKAYVYEKIREEIPGIVIENCSSGGHRSEPSMMELCSQGSFSDAHETAAIPIIAANMHRVMLPSQSQIWAVMRPGDSSDRIHYSICNTFLGRMCLSGDIYGLADWQWELIDDGMEFYRRAADVIKHGRTVRIESSPKSYNNPTGEQVVVREYDGVTLVVAHRFANSKPVDLSFLNGRKLLCEYGELERDFSAKAWLLG